MAINWRGMDSLPQELSEKVKTIDPKAVGHCWVEKLSSGDTVTVLFDKFFGHPIVWAKAG